MTGDILYPSIFNDVIGPVMRGPSSSHCAAALRIGRLARDLMGGEITDVDVLFDPESSLATTHETQGSDMGLFGGLLGWEATDERLPQSGSAIRKAGIAVRIKIETLRHKHPNTYHLVLRNRREQHQVTAVSTGGGMVRLVDIDSITVDIRGDFYETLIFTGQVQEIVNFLGKRYFNDCIITTSGGLIRIKAQKSSEAELINELTRRFPEAGIRRLSPVLPVLSRRNMQVPFLNAASMIKKKANRIRPLWELAVEYESHRGALSKAKVMSMMTDILKILQESVRIGLAGTAHADRILGHQSGNFISAMQNEQLLEAGMLNKMIAYITALMEVKSAMGIIVAAPTAGACAALPGAVIAAAEYKGLGDEAMSRALLAGGMIGIFITAGATFAAEIGGCQAETGAAAGMAAAALTDLAGGSVEQALNAASMALQNSLGMICDPVANRVEVPCLGKNVLAAANALSCANMALAGYDPVIPLDEVIETMDRVGKSLPRELCCTALGGLSVTPTSKRLENSLKIQLP